MRGNGRVVAATAYASMALPFLLGATLAWAWHDRLAPGQPLTWPFVAFVGLSMSITAFPVLVRILDEHGIASTRLGVVATSCAALQDATAWVVLALVTSLVTGADVSIARTLVWLGAYGMAMASNYNTRPRAAEVMIVEGEPALVRERERVEQLFAGERTLPA